MMAPQAAVDGAFHCGISNNALSTPSTTPVITVIQKEMVSVATGMVVLRSLWVPSAQVAAPISAQTTATGLPVRAVSSCHSNRETPRPAAATPSQLRAFRRLPKNQAPSNAEKIGMV